MIKLFIDLESVLIPELWPAFLDQVGLDADRSTTRELSDVQALFDRRFAVLEENGIPIDRLREGAETLSLFEGAREFLDALRSLGECMIITDNCDYLIEPLLPLLQGIPVCSNHLDLEPKPCFRYRQEGTKEQIVRRETQAGHITVAIGDSFNDLGMLHAATIGILYRPSVSVAKSAPSLPKASSYAQVISMIENLLI